MPSVKLGTVVKDVAGSVKGMVGGSEYRERLGVIRMAIGQLGFTPEEMQRNVKTFMEQIKKDMAQLSDRINKEIHEVVSFTISFPSITRYMITAHLETDTWDQVLSSTNSPAFTLNGEFRSDNSLPTKDLAVL